MTDLIYGITTPPAKPTSMFQKFLSVKLDQMILAHLYPGHEPTNLLYPNPQAVLEEAKATIKNAKRSLGLARAQLRATAKANKPAPIAPSPFAPIYSGRCERLNVSYENERRDNQVEYREMNQPVDIEVMPKPKRVLYEGEISCELWSLGDGMGNHMHAPTQEIAEKFFPRSGTTKIILSVGTGRKIRIMEIE